MKGKLTPLKDHLHFADADFSVVFNHYSFCELIKHIMVEYGNVTYDAAAEKLKKSYLIKIPNSINDVEYLTQELEFHWAMLLVHGNMYWLKGIPSDFNDFKEDYLKWESETRLKHNLKKSYEYFEIEHKKKKKQ